jgi:hypothetical protein
MIAGDLSAGVVISRSTCARARSTTTRGAVTRAATPSRATSFTAEVVGRGGEAQQVALETLRGVGPLRRAEIAEQLTRPPQVAHDLQTVQPVLDRGDLGLRDRLEHVERRPQAGVGYVTVEPGELGEGGGGRRVATGESLFARIGEPVVEPLVADHRAEGRV